MLTKKALRELKMDTESNLKKAVITDLLSQGSTDDIQTYISDLLQHGCVSGMVASLIYYNDTDKFFIKHHDEIFDLLNNYKDDVGEFPNFEINANNLAWFGYEYTVQQIASDLGIE